jgi:LPS sulfotransferase NodH
MRLRVAAQQVRAFAYLAARGVPAGQRKFVIFAQSRTGSSLLVDLLNAHPQVRCEGELLMHRVLAPRRFVEGNAARAATDAYGFKVKIYQLSNKQGLRPGEFLHDLHDRGWQVIYLRRDNILRQTISILAAKARGAYSHAVNDGPLRDRTLAVDVPLLLNILRKRSQHVADEAACLVGIPHAEVCYEDDLLRETAQRETAARLFRLINVADDVLVKTKWVRTGRDILADSIANYREVEAALVGTQFEKYLSDRRYENGAAANG